MSPEGDVAGPRGRQAGTTRGVGEAWLRTRCGSGIAELQGCGPGPGGGAEGAPGLGSCSTRNELSPATQHEVSYFRGVSLPSLGVCKEAKQMSQHHPPREAELPDTQEATENGRTTQGPPVHTEGAWVLVDPRTRHSYPRVFAPAAPLAGYPSPQPTSSSQGRRCSNSTCSERPRRLHSPAARAG